MLKVVILKKRGLYYNKVRTGGSPIMTQFKTSLFGYKKEEVKKLIYDLQTRHQLEKKRLEEEISKWLEENKRIKLEIDKERIR
jgi:hypothetical protein